MIKSLLRSTPRKYLNSALDTEFQMAYSLLNKEITPEANESFINKMCPAYIDPYFSAQKDLEDFNADILKRLQTSETQLNLVTQHLFKFTGKKIRPTLMFLLARALAGPNEQDFKGCILTEAQKVFTLVIEMIHTCSLMHDDVIDLSNTRRGKPTVHSLYGNRSAVLGGDYLISTASYMCTELGDIRLMQEISQIMENLSRGELIQMDSRGAIDLETLMLHYVHKTYYKTASLISHGCRGIGMHSLKDYAEPAFNYGKHLGLAFQYIDDVLDFIGDAAELGKPMLNDMKSGIATGPVLFACKDNPELLEAVGRQFKGRNDIDLGYECAMKTGIVKTKHLALMHLQKALESLEHIPEGSYSYSILTSLGSHVYSRTK
mmetsp:Transcript_1908/g.4222  ORF Transcript_1908/g.4222 Transcript_1908/m.4222 type:complete len:376 (+) Transcript_1908:1814-2941(+)